MANYLCFTALEGSNRIIQNIGKSGCSYQYSTDEGATWNNVTIGYPVYFDNKVYWKGDGIYNSSIEGISIFSFANSNNKVSASGSVMSLIDGTGDSTVIPEGNSFMYMFKNCIALTTAPEFSATTLTNECYGFAFQGCSSLTTAPSLLPAQVLTKDCYRGMFYGCRSLTTFPELPSTTLAEGCYSAMFYSCISLSEAPELPATNLATNCYNAMFCYSSLTVAPKLPATTLAYGCYISMFGDCTSLVEAPELPATTLADSCYDAMFFYCSSLTVAPELPATELASDCYSYMFGGCKSLVTAPELPATTLADSCYYAMFCYCSSLTVAPELPATELASNCYSYMFGGCTSLTEAPELPATTLAYGCYYAMFYYCTSLTVAPKLPATTLAEYCYYAMFQGCTSLTKAPKLPATTLAEYYCYVLMFYDCTLIDKVYVDGPVDYQVHTQGWLGNVAPSGTVYASNKNINLPRDNESGIPVGWNLESEGDTSDSKLIILENLRVFLRKFGGDLGFEENLLYNGDKSLGTAIGELQSSSVQDSERTSWNTMVTEVSKKQNKMEVLTDDEIDSICK